MIKGTCYSCDKEHLNLQKGVNNYILTNDGRQHYPFKVVPFYWLNVKYQYVHHFLQQDVERILRKKVNCIIHTET